MLACVVCKHWRTAAGGRLECACEKCLCFDTMSGKAHRKEGDSSHFAYMKANNQSLKPGVVLCSITYSIHYTVHICGIFVYVFIFAFDHSTHSRALSTIISNCCRILNLVHQQLNILSWYVLYLLPGKCYLIWPIPLFSLLFDSNLGWLVCNAQSKWYCCVHSDTWAYCMAAPRAPDFSRITQEKLPKHCNIT